MRKKHLKYLVCPACQVQLLLSDIEAKDEDSIKSGVLICSKCGRRYSIENYIPRFVPSQNYASGFGLEWTIHARTQYDSYSGCDISETRFFNETRWSRNLSGQVILEVGGGSGRFTEQAESTGAMVISLDYSYAVEANYASNGHKDNVMIVQGDLYNMPFRRNFFDKIFCFGVLQHTPDVEKAFMVLPQYLKSGGSIVIDVYRKYSGLKGLFKTKYWVRPVTKKIPARKLYYFVKRYVEFMWPLTKLLNKIPYFGKRLIWMLLIADYRGVYNLSEDLLGEWAILDTFDLLSPAFDQPQTIETVRGWFKDAGLCGVEVNYGYNGIEGRGIKP